MTGLPGLSAAQLAVYPNPVTEQGALLQGALSQLPATVSAVRVQLVDALRVVATTTLAARQGEAATAVGARSAAACTCCA